MVFRTSGFRVCRQCTRRFLAPALALADDVVVLEAVAKHQPRAATFGGVVRQLLSSHYANSISETYTTPVVAAAAGTRLHREIHYWLRRNDFEALVDFLVRATSTSSWSQHLTPAELAYIMGQAVQHQVKLNRNLASAKASRESAAVVDRRAAEARAFRSKFRDVYSNILFGTTRVSIYDRSLRRDLYGGEHNTGYRLLVQDYQNLINFEYNNFKLDLATKWFERLEAQHGLDSMTKEMWSLRFKVYARGDAKLWGSFHNELYDKKTDLVLGHAQKRSLGLLLKEYLGHHKDIDHDMLATVIHCLGHGGNVNQLYGLIEDKWGIDKLGTKVKNVVSAPTLDVLTAIVVVLSHKQEYFQSMVYVNSFQDHFGVELSGKEAIPFWIELFRASDLTTRFQPQLALKYYLENFNPHVNFDKLEKLQQNVDFDYEGYLSFEEQLRNKRQNIMNLIWKLYTSTHNTFSVDCLRIYSRFVAETPSESDFFSLLTFMNEKYHSYHVSPDSFNSDLLNNTARGVYRLYINTMVDLIKFKCSKGFIGQCRFLIEEWSLNEDMKIELHELFVAKLQPAYQSRLDAKRKQLMIEQRQEDRFLDLL